METIKGYVEHIIYRNEDNGYTVLSLVTEDGEVTCTGSLEYIDEGSAVEIKGSYTSHQIYGEQFKIDSYEITQPEDAVSIERYLGSGAIKGLGAALAGRIVKKFAEETFRIMEEEPERLAEVKGISEKKAREIALQVEEKKELRNAMIFLQKYGISTSLAVKIYNQYKERMYSILVENPYQMADDIQGVGFKMADEIATKAGIRTDSDFRIKSGILYTLLQAATDGHVYLPYNMLLQKAGGLLGIEEVHLETHIGNLAIEKKLVIKKCEQQVNVYGANFYYLELNCANMLHGLNLKSEEDEDSIEKKLKKLEDKSEILLEELQRTAVIEAVRNGVVIISGGPGTGKTTTINMIIRYFIGEGLDIYLAAPTGRAAKRMTEATGYEAKTIHRLLELSGMPENDMKGISFERNEQNPLEADAIIIDEMSMVDIFLFQSLLKAISIGTKLVMVGDVNQLPSVGPGSILKDIINSKYFSVVMLKKIFRQASTSDIVVNAHKINAGQELILDNNSKDFFFLKREDSNVIISVIIRLIKEKLPKYINVEPYEIQVLSPMRKGLLGVERLNSILQEYLNPPHKNKKEKEYRDGTFREGDKVMQIKNNYQLEWEVLSKYGIPVDKGMGIFNGDMGIIKEINTYSETMLIEFDDHRQVTYAFKQMEELELAYAITIHKSQGSEYPAVIMPLLNGPQMLMTRNLLYTGVTRARACVTLVGSLEAVELMIGNICEQKRFTGLKDRIMELGI